MEEIKRNLRFAIGEKNWEEASKIFARAFTNASTKESVLRDHNILYNAMVQDAPTGIVEQLVSPQNINIQLDDELNTPLHIAVGKQRWELIEILVDHGADINLCNKFRFTALHVAVEAGVSVDVIPKVISPLNINLKTELDDTALFLTILKRRWELVPVLLHHGADINVFTGTGPPLHAAILSSPVNIITQLISPQNINEQRENDGMAALQLAVSFKRWECVSLLIEKGANIDLRMMDNKTALHTAVFHDSPEDIIVQLISPQTINVPDKNGRTALHIAVIENRSLNVVQLLIQNGADINHCDQQRDLPALQYAVYRGRSADFISQLISPQNINAGSITALHMATTKGRWSLVPLLIANGADVNMRSSGMHETPLHVSIRNKAPADTITQLISPHNINIQDGLCRTPLYMVVKDHSSWTELVPLLLQYGADPYVQGKSRLLPPVQHTLASMCISAIRKHMPVKTDAAFEELGLPQNLLLELKLKHLAVEIETRKRNRSFSSEDED